MLDVYKRQGRYRINKKLNLTTDMDVRVLTKEDIIEIIKYLIAVSYTHLRHLFKRKCLSWKSITKI